MLFFKRNNILAFFILFLTSVVAQTLPCKNISINDGLPSNGIKCFFKDSRGLMWIGTEAGLCSYNGSYYKIYNETNGLKHSEIWTIAEDDNHNLWLSMYGNGLAKFDGKKFTYYSKKDGLVNNAIRKIYYSKKHNCLVLGTENGISLFDGKRFKSFIPKSCIKHFQVVGINEYENKVLVTVSHDNVYSINFNSKIEKTSLKIEFKPQPTYSAFINDGEFYSGIEHFNIKDLKTAREIVSYPSAIIWDYTKDNNNNIYAAAWNVNAPNGNLYQYSNNQLIDITQKASIESKGLWCLYYDQQTKQLWVGSIDKGIYIVDLSGKVNFYYSSFYNIKHLQAGCLYKDSNNNLWIGGSDHIIVQHPNLNYDIIDKSSLWNKIKDYFRAKPLLKNSDIYKDFNGSQSKKNNFGCFNITEDKDNNIWVTTTIGYLCFDKNYKLLYYYSSEGGYLIFNNQEQLIFSEIYNNTYIKKNKFENVRGTEMSVKDKSTPKDINKVLYHDKIIWFGTNYSGLFKYENNQFCSLNENGQFKEKNIKDLKVTSKGELIVGTNSGRVYITKWDGTKLKIIHTYLPNKELFGTSILFVEQSHGAYFIGTNYGINIIQNNHFVKLLNKSEGINDIQFNDCTKDKNGDLWITTNNGLIKINVKECLKQNINIKNPIKINSIKVNGAEYSNTSNYSWGSFEKPILSLKYFQNDIEISFESYNLFNADKNLYRYKVIGLSKKWSDLDSNSKIQLLGLPYGKYTIVIEGKNNGTGTVFLPKRLILIIATPFWKTWWFIISCIILMLIVGFIGYKKRIQYIEEREQAKGVIQKRLVETKMEALQSQMNPHFIFNAMNSIQNFIIDNNTDEALMYMGEFSKLIRQTLDNSSKQRIRLEDEIHYLKTYITLENLRQKEKVNFKLSISHAIDTFEIQIPPMLIQPFIENVFIHAFDKSSINPTLELNFSKTSNFIVCEIKDNGKAMNTKELFTNNKSKGIKLVQERLRLLQQDNSIPVIINSISSIGTSVLLKIQLN